MHLTRRGYALVAVVVLVEVRALAFGAGALNAIAAPAVVALLAAAVQVRRTEAPSVDRAPVPPGFPGDSREVVVSVEGRGVARLTDSVPDGLVAEDATAEASLPTDLSYRVDLDDRGRHELGPLGVRVSDLLGLVATTHETWATTEVLVYPPVYVLADRDRVLRNVIDRTAVERQQFDTVREYTPGDPMRDVHWKSTAKDPEGMYVTEFADHRTEGSVVLAATSDRGQADEMAAAAASVAAMVLDAGVAVELRTPSATVPSGTGTDHRDRLLRTLATADGGDLPTWPEAVDFHVHAGDDGVTLTVGSTDHSLEDLTVSRSNPLVDREVTA